MGSGVSGVTRVYDVICSDSGSNCILEHHVKLGLVSPTGRAEGRTGCCLVAVLLAYGVHVAVLQNSICKLSEAVYVHSHRKA